MHVTRWLSTHAPSSFLLTSSCFFSLSAVAPALSFLCSSLALRACQLLAQSGFFHTNKKHKGVMSYCLLSIFSALIKSLMRVVIFSLHSRGVKSLPEWQRFSATLSHTVLYHLKGSWWERTSLNRAISSSDEQRRRLATDWTAGREEELGATGEQGGMTQEMEEEDMLKKNLNHKMKAKQKRKFLLFVLYWNCHTLEKIMQNQARNVKSEDITLSL